LLSILSTSLGMTLASFRDQLGNKNYFASIKEEKENFIYEKCVMTCFIASDYLSRGIVIALVGRHFGVGNHALTRFLEANLGDFPFEAMIWWVLTVVETMFELAWDRAELFDCKDVGKLALNVMAGFTCSRWFLKQTSWESIRPFFLCRHGLLVLGFLILYAVKNWEVRLYLVIGYAFSQIAVVISFRILYFISWPEPSKNQTVGV